MSFGETIFLFVLALIVFGPKKLPEIARQVGRYMNEFKRASNEFRSQIEQEISHLDREDATRKILPPSEPPAGATSRDPTSSSSEPVNSAPESPATLAISASDAPPASSAEPATAATEAGPAADTAAAVSSQESHA